ncbi:MAG TPA: glycoside hydrolase family 2 TIM barrel-domain containing protein [Chthonomonadales bacterium]|nr:glycoside hydrolase family 2 TIM barrel-domain containing protein [Chthonomonadales bacterium]
MRRTHDLSELRWTLSGWTPDLWRMMQTMELGQLPDADVPGLPASVPGSVQKALLDAGLLPDWRVGDNARSCEWVENRHWVYETHLPDEWLEAGLRHRLRCEGLDYSGWVFVNEALAGEFRGTHVPHVFDLTSLLRPVGNRLRIVFDCPPRWLGQFGFTSRVREWKARFNYTWDWQPRLVQIGIWEPVALDSDDGEALEGVRCTAAADVAGEGSLRVWGRAAGGKKVSVRLSGPAGTVREETVDARAFTAVGIAWHAIPVDLWWPNLEGDRPLYTVACTLLDTDGVAIDRVEWRVGFRRIEWRACEGAPEGADPWICVVNSRPVFLQGVNFPPLLANFADATPDHYRRLLDLYADLGVNIIRINGVGYLERQVLYDLCDERGILVWQDVPLSSSGIENVAPSDERSIDEMGAVLRSFIARRQHHPSLLLWCGGNELHDRHEDGTQSPHGLDHPMMARFRQIVDEEDPGRRFVPTTASGPRECADEADFGKGLHWDVHGPWKLWDGLDAWRAYWERDDALFRSETGAPAASPEEVILRYAGRLDPLPVDARNLLWRRPVAWWIEPAAFEAERCRPPATLGEYVDWSQERQVLALSIAMRSARGRFPRCGGMILWCGHDCFPCPANTSIVDVEGNPKPAALALREIWRAGR